MSLMRRMVGATSGTLIGGALLACALFAGAPMASADTQSLAKCVAHYANTAAWADCEGGSEKSWARIAVKCSSGWKHSDWVRVDPGRTKTVRYECTKKAHAAKAEVRKY